MTDGSRSSVSDRKALSETLVELVDTRGHAIGVSTKLAAHDPPGQLHRAFSVFLIDPDGRVLIQRRALSKYHSAGLWSNTCCGHPAPGEDVSSAAARRLADELGIRIEPIDLHVAAQVTYELSDPVSGRIEREYDHVLVGRSAAIPAPNRDEVAEVALAAFDDLAPARINGPEFTAWFPIVLDAALPMLLNVG
jgi:isopentenyl-diphosphate delta-isomerase